MKLDVLRMLDLEYLNSLISEIHDKISHLNVSFLEQYSLEKLNEMNKDDIVKLFDKYGVSSESIIKYFESDYIDENWEFADLFFDDIAYSSKLKEQAKNDALNELELLNNQINSINSSIENELLELNNTENFLKMLIRLLNGNDLSEEDVDSLHEFISNSSFNDEEEFIFSYNIVKYILENRKDFSLKISDDNIDEFEKELNDIYLSSHYNDESLEISVDEPVYSETITGRYEYYKKLFDEADLGDTLGQIMDNCLELCEGLNPLKNTLPKSEFCVLIGSLLYILNENHGKEVVNQDIIADVYADLAILDKLYEEDLSLLSYKEKMISLLKDDLDIASRFKVKCNFKNRIINRLNLLLLEFQNNLINSTRQKEIDEEYSKIKQDFIILPETVKQIKNLKDLKNRIEQLLSKSTTVVVEEYYFGLAELQSSVISLIEMVEENGASSEISIELSKIIAELRQYSKTNKSKNNILLNGFVLFDFDENGKPYVMSDLDLQNSHNLIDVSNEQNKINSSFSDYSKLINDLLIYGEPEILNGEIPSNIERILDKVYLDNERNKPTKMIRIRPRRNSLVRFVTQKVVLRSDTEIFKQVLSIIKEILPNAQIDTNKDFVLYVNIASLIKGEATDSYNVCINRYNRKSLLYKLLLENIHKSSLTDEECSLLKDIVHMSMNAYYELEKKNEHLKFDIIKQIGGMKNRG